jgi:hypothetical protein
VSTKDSITVYNMNSFSSCQGDDTHTRNRIRPALDTTTLQDNNNHMLYTGKSSIIKIRQPMLSFSWLDVNADQSLKFACLCEDDAISVKHVHTNVVLKRFELDKVAVMRGKEVQIIDANIDDDISIVIQRRAIQGYAMDVLSLFVN